MAALEDKVSTLGKEADRLCGIHADHADQIQSKRAEIEDYWESLTAKAKVGIGLYTVNVGHFCNFLFCNRDVKRGWMNRIPCTDSWRISEISFRGSMT